MILLILIWEILKSYSAMASDWLFNIKFSVTRISVIGSNQSSYNAHKKSKRTTILKDKIKTRLIKIGYLILIAVLKLNEVILNSTTEKLKGLESKNANGFDRPMKRLLLN